MNKEIKGYLKAEAIISAAFNFFINGMIAALVHHKADTVATDVISVAINLTATSVLIFILTALFNRASLRRTKTVGVLETRSRMIHYLSRLFWRTVLFSLVMGLTIAIILAALPISLFTMLGIWALAFGVYVALKCVFFAMLGGGVTALELYMGMCKTG